MGTEMNNCTINNSAVCLLIMLIRKTVSLLTVEALNKEHFVPRKRHFRVSLQFLITHWCLYRELYDPFPSFLWRWSIFSIDPGLIYSYSVMLKLQVVILNRSNGAKIITPSFSWKFLLLLIEGLRLLFHNMGVVKHFDVNGYIHLTFFPF